MILFIDEFEKILIKYQIAKSDVCLVGSNALANAGFRNNHDFDFAIRSDAREKLLAQYKDELKVLPSGTICFTDNVQILQHRYGVVGVTDDMLFTDKFSKPYEEMRIARLEVEIAKKINRSAEKDDKDLKEIGDSDLAETLDWNEILQLAYLNKSKPIKNNPVKCVGHTIKKVIKHPTIVFTIVRKTHRHKAGNGAIVPATSPLNLIEKCFRNDRRDVLISVLALLGYISGNEKKQLFQIFGINEMLLQKAYHKCKNDSYDVVITIDKDGNLVGNGYSLAATVALNKPIVALKTVQSLNTPAVDAYCIPRTLETILEEKINNLIVDTGIYFCAIVWGAAKDQFTEIINDIDKEYPVIGYSIVENIENYTSFISDVYAIDNVEKWKIRIKQEYLRNKQNSICVIIFDIKEPDFRENQRTGLWLSDKGAQLKNNIRQKYRKYLDNYIYDVIIHTGDNYQINRELIELTKKYAGHPLFTDYKQYTRG